MKHFVQILSMRHEYESDGKLRFSSYDETFLIIDSIIDVPIEDERREKHVYVCAIRKLQNLSCIRSYSI